MLFCKYNVNINVINNGFQIVIGVIITIKIFDLSDHKIQSFIFERTQSIKETEAIRLE